MIFINASTRNTLKMFQQFLPIYIPVGIGYLISILKSKNISSYLVDQEVDENVPGLVDEYVKKIEKPYIFAFSVLTAGLKKSVELAKQLKIKYPDAVIIFGGVHPTAMPEEVLSIKEIDYVMRGEAEKSILDFYNCIKNGGDIKTVKNLSYRSNGKVIHNERNPITLELDKIPPLPYSLFASKSDRYDFSIIVSSRGCPFNCIFCSNRITTGKKYRFRSSEKIVEELDMLYHKYNKKNIMFLDDNFLVSKKRIYHLIELINKKGLAKKMNFSFQARCDNVTPQLLKDMYNSGFRDIFFGIETASEKIMEIIRKGETVAECVETVKIAQDVGMNVDATFIYGFPEETFKDRIDCIKLNQELNLTSARYNNATPYPGTQLYEIAKKQNRLNVRGLYENFNSVSTLIESPFKKTNFSYVPPDNTEDEIRRDLLLSYFCYYLRFSRIKNLFSKSVVGKKFSNKNKANVISKLKKVIYLLGICWIFLIKFFQLFYYIILKKDTRISYKYFLKIFTGFKLNKT